MFGLEINKKMIVFLIIFIKSLLVEDDEFASRDCIQNYGIY
jgi:hypothetical protein